MANPTHVSDADFQSEVLQAEQPVLVDFWAEWCPPCKMLEPIVADLATEYDNRIKVAKLDVDANPETAGKFGVMSIPTLILFKDGEPKVRLIGAKPKGQLVQELAGYL